MDKKDDLRKSKFIHISKNLYIVFTPLKKSKGTETERATDIEYFFDDATRLIKHKNGKCFNTENNRNENNDLSKAKFATDIIKKNKNKIDFKSFKPLLNAINDVIEHYSNTSSTNT